MVKPPKSSKKPLSQADKVQYAQNFAKAMTNRLGEKAKEGADDGKKQ